jgi:N-acetylneuraminic acid mutarotase
VQSNRWHRLVVISMVAAFAACESTTPSDPVGSAAQPTPSPTAFVLQSPFGTPRPRSTEQPPPRPTPPPPNAQYWTRLADLSEPRHRHAAALLPDGRVMVMGGTNIIRDPDGTGRDYITLASTEVFDPATGGWTPGPPLRDGRAEPNAMTLPDGRVLVVGDSIPSVEIFDPTTNRWSRVAQLPSRHGWGSATLLLDGRVLIIGRTDRDYPREQAASIFDPVTSSWRATASTNLVRGGHATVLLADGTVLVTGGSHPDSHVADPMPDAAIYDPESDRWRDVGPMEVRLFLPLATTLLDGRVFMQAETGAQLFDPTTRTWTRTNMSGEHSIDAWVRLADGRVLALDDYPGQIHVYDPSTDAWSHLGQFMELAHSPFSLLPDGRVLVAGGYHGCLDHNPCALGDIAETWLFDPAGGD